jgi:hypothetical protein
MANDKNLPMVNHNAREYTMQDWEDAKDEDLESLKFYRVEPEMEIGVAADLLHRVLEAAYKRDVKAVSDFQRNLDDFVRREVSHFRELQDEIYREIRQGEKRTSD